MSRLFAGNFEFEHQLARDVSRSVPRTALELAPAWIAVAGEGDVLWLPEPPEEDFADAMAAQGFPRIRWVSSSAELDDLLRSETLSLCPWGWSESVARWARERKLSMDPPRLEAVRSANSRRFSFGLEQELGIALPKASAVFSLEELQSAVKAFALRERWVLKSEFGMSARERVLGQGPEVPPNSSAWAKKRLRSGQALFLEPWVTSLAEAGLQFEVPKTEAPVFLGLTPMFTDAVGAYRGSRFDPAAETDPGWSDAIHIGHTVARRVQKLGYFGPLGIDAMWYRDTDGTAKLRPVQDVNARWTMGRLSLGFRSLLGAQELGAWLHRACPAVTVDEARRSWKERSKTLPREVRLLRTSPWTIGRKVTRHATAVVIVPNAETLHRTVELLLTG